MNDAERANQVAVDLAAFADIGAEAPAVEETNAGYVIRLARLGDVAELTMLPGGKIAERCGDNTIKHLNFRALLASERYGNLRDWAKQQNAFLTSSLEKEGELIPISGLLNNVSAVDMAQIDERLVAEQKNNSSRVLLIDGPAGIGKTQFITGLAAKRAETFLISRRPLLLHVESRGRVLSHIYQLMAFSLQRLRLTTTYDQIPILAKHGLVTIAIDGFDELADPDGYDKAWSQVNDLIAELRGSGSIILAGRETFIGRDRLLR